MRKFLAISLLLIVFLSQVGYYLISNYQRSALKESMREELRSRSAEKDMQVIVLEENAAAIRWEEDGKEFYLDGKLYDVASIEKQNGKTLIHCVCDKDEAQLANNVAKAVASANDKTNSKESKHIVKFQVSDYILYSIDRTTHPVIAPSTEYIDFDVTLFSSSHSVDIGPPRA